MNTHLTTFAEAPAALGAPARLADRAPYRYRSGRAADAVALLALIDANKEIGHLLARTLEELADHSSRFVVATQAGSIVGCAELAPLGARVAEVRSLVVDEAHRGCGISSRLIRELRERASKQGFATLCAFTHDATHFLGWGFEVAPHADVPEKVAADCNGCRLLGRCGQYAMVLPLGDAVSRASRPGGRRIFRVTSREAKVA